MSIDINETILIPVGSELSPEEKDRPLAYHIKTVIEEHSQGVYQKAIVVSDRWYIENEMFHLCPTIFIGGPGVNAALDLYYNEIPVIWSDNEATFLQMKTGQDDIKVALWGLTQMQTNAAIERFLHKYLNQFLAASWKQS